MGNYCVVKSVVAGVVILKNGEGKEFMRSNISVQVFNGLVKEGIPVSLVVSEMLGSAVVALVARKIPHYLNVHLSDISWGVGKGYHFAPA